jgi:hypothetical protein
LITGGNALIIGDGWTRRSAALKVKPTLEIDVQAQYPYLAKSRRFLIAYSQNP